MLSKAASPETGCSYKWRLNTKFGPLLVSIHESDFTKAGNLKKKKGRTTLASIFCCFDKDAQFSDDFKKQFDMRWSHKWNFHLSQEDGDTKSVWEYCFNLFSYELERILM